MSFSSIENVPSTCYGAQEKAPSELPQRDVHAIVTRLSDGCRNDPLQRSADCRTNKIQSRLLLIMTAVFGVAIVAFLVAVQF
jgi:hypothetical protein